MKKKHIKSAAGILTMAGAASAIISAGVGNFFYNYALNPKNKRNILEPEDKEEAKRKREEKQQQEKARRQWLKERTSTVFLYGDGKKYKGKSCPIKLKAYCSFRESPVYVLICHGYMGRAEDMVDYAKHFYEKGFNILLPDARGHGDSQGDYIGMGWHERMDILKWIDFILDRHPHGKIYLYGVSMGAATVMMTSGEELPENVKLMIEDCGYTSVWDQFAKVLKESFGLKPFPVMQIASIVTRLRAGYTLHEASALRQVEKSRLPMLFIHGDQDTFVPFSMLDQLYEAAGSQKKERLVIKGAGHAEAMRTAPEEYWGCIDQFTERYGNQRP